MKSFPKSVAGLLAALAVVVYSGCSDDEPNILGLNESAKYGSIRLTFEGTRPDNVPFKVTKTYRYITGFGPAGSSTYKTREEDGAIIHEWRATRLYDPFDGSSRSANITINGREEDGVLMLTQSSFNASSALTFDDQTALSLVVTFGSLDPEDITYGHNEDNGKFKAKFTALVPADYNSTDHDLTVTGEVSVILYKPLN